MGIGLCPGGFFNHQITIPSRQPQRRICRFLRTRTPILVFDYGVGSLTPGPLAANIILGPKMLRIVVLPPYVNAFLVHLPPVRWDRGRPASDYGG